MRDLSNIFRTEWPKKPWSGWDKAGSKNSIGLRIDLRIKFRKLDSKFLNVHRTSSVLVKECPKGKKLYKFMFVFHLGMGGLLKLAGNNCSTMCDALFTSTHKVPLLSKTIM